MYANGWNLSGGGAAVGGALAFTGFDLTGVLVLACAACLVGCLLLLRTRLVRRERPAQRQGAGR
ncbi:hypothetical protein GCM10017714_32350 [Curtobacterium pusillum]|uniref:MFS transporter n=1 Tax=Curtobacterium pusillum TaxID=69373 RepID=A0AAW3T8H1_9MICO|nr:hypothetical protein [Curtobacterium pusillum]GLK31731.1 hypothetical protein GCM10017610_20160 [Curtobacterium pusillum]